MFRRAVAWYFSSIFLEQHVEPFGTHTCRSDPGERHKEGRKFALGRGSAGSGEETNSIHWYTLLQLPFGQIDDVSGICPEEAAWPKEKTDKAEPGLLSNSPRELAMYACQHAACFSSHTLHPLMCWCRAERYSPSPGCLLHAYQHVGKELQAAEEMEWEAERAARI